MHSLLRARVPRCTAYALLAALLAPASPLAAQDAAPAGRIMGRVVDQASGQTFEQNIGLDVATVTLTAAEFTFTAEGGTMREALEQQREAAGIVSAVAAEQISRSPDSDATAAVQRVSGVTVHGGRFVHVRRLGERYTTTSLNGARMPSPEPEKKAVPLDLFPASLLRSLTTSKTFTPDQPGDFSGAQVDILTREFPLRRTIAYSMAVGANMSATGRNALHGRYTPGCIDRHEVITMSSHT